MAAHVLELAVRLNDLPTIALAADAAVREHSSELAQALAYLNFDTLRTVLDLSPGLVPPDVTTSELISEIVSFQSALLRTDPLPHARLAEQLHIDIHASSVLERLFKDVATVSTFEPPRGAIQLVDRYDSLSDDEQLAKRDEFWARYGRWTSVIPPEEHSVIASVAQSTSPLTRLDPDIWEHLAIAGGSIVACLTGTTERDANADSDVDLFLCGTEPHELAEKVEELSESLLEAFRECGDAVRHVARYTPPLVVRSLHTLNFFSSHYSPTTQLVLHSHPTPEHIVDEFDLDIVSFYARPHQPIVAAPRAARALAWSGPGGTDQVLDPGSLRASLDPAGRRSSRRLAKYALRGCGLLVSAEAIKACGLTEWDVQQLVDQANALADAAIDSDKPWRAIADLEGLSFAIGATLLEANALQLGPERRTAKKKRRGGGGGGRHGRSYMSGDYSDEMDEDIEEELSSVETASSVSDLLPEDEDDFDAYAIAELTTSTTYVRLDRDYDPFKMRAIVHAHSVRTTQGIRKLFEFEGGKGRVVFRTTACYTTLQDLDVARYIAAGFPNDLSTVSRDDDDHVLQGLQKMPETLFRKLAEIIEANATAELPATGILAERHRITVNGRVIVYAHIKISTLLAFGGISADLDVVRRIVFQGFDVTLTPALHLLRIEARKTDGKRLTRAEAQPVLDKLNADVFALEDKFDRALAFARKPRIAPVFVHGQVDETTTLAYLRSERMT